MSFCLDTPFFAVSSLELSRRGRVLDRVRGEVDPMRIAQLSPLRTFNGGLSPWGVGYRKTASERVAGDGM